MNNDKELRTIFDNAPVEDLVPGFDAATEWEQLSKRLKPQRKKVPLTRYLPYAAAAVLLILLLQKDRSSLTLVAFRNAPVQEAQHRPGQVVSAEAAQAKKQRLRTVPVQHPDLAPTAAAPALPKQDTAEVVVAVASSAPQKVSLPVKHYADISAVQQAAEDAPVVSRQKKGFWHSLIARRRIAPQTDKKDEAPIRGLIYALNQE